MCSGDGSVHQTNLSGGLTIHTATIVFEYSMMPLGPLSGMVLARQPKSEFRATLDGHRKSWY